MMRLLALLRKEFVQVRRDTFSMRLLFLLPIVQTLLLGYAMTRDVRHIALAVVDLDRSPLSRSLSLHLRHHNRFLDHGLLPSVDVLRHDLQKGQVVLGLVIPRGFGQSVERSLSVLNSGEKNEDASVSIVVDGQDAASAGIAASYAAAIVQKWSQEKIQQAIQMQGVDVRSQQPLELRDRILFNSGLDYAWYMVPGMIILLITMTGALLTSFSLVREREKGTLEQLLVTPIRPVQILFSKAIPYWLLSQLTFYLALLVVGLWYGLPLWQARWIGLAWGLALYTLTSVSLGLLVSSVVHSQQQALFLIWFCLIFFILTSGFILPFESMPLWMQHLTELNAVRHFLFLVRALVLRQSDPATLMPEYVKLMVIAMGLFLISVMMFRRRSA